MNSVDNSETDRVSITCRRGEPQSSYSRLTHFLAYLAFEGHGVRIGLELTACVLLYMILSVAVPWKSVAVSLSWGSVISWFASCLLVALFDQLVLCRPVYTYRHSYRFDLGGAYDRALALLESIGPNSSALVRCPKAVYHLRRADILTHAERYAQAADELDKAFLLGTNYEQVSLAQNRFLRAQGCYQEARAEFERIKSVFGDTPLVILEEALLSLDERKDLWKARRAFERVLELPNVAHYYGETTKSLARAYLHITYLWTGSAEKGLDGLETSVAALRSQAYWMDTLRPVLAFLLAERAYYWATHKEPLRARQDLEEALSICTYPQLRDRARQVREELSWRFPSLS